MVMQGSDSVLNGSSEGSDSVLNGFSERQRLLQERRRRREIARAGGAGMHCWSWRGGGEVSSQQCLLFLENMASFCAGRFKKGSRSMRRAGRWKHGNRVNCCLKAMEGGQVWRRDQVILMGKARTTQWPRHHPFPVWFIHSCKVQFTLVNHHWLILTLCC